jgi:hypothetical protein
MTSPSVNIGFGLLGAFVVIGGGIAAYATFGPTDSPVAVKGGKRHSRRKHRSGRKTRKHQACNP